MLINAKHLSEGEVGADGGVANSARRSTSSSVQQRVVCSYDVRLRSATYDSVTIVHDLCQIAVSVVAAVIAARLPHVQSYALCT